jgi:hypothetical protein
MIYLLSVAGSYREKDTGNVAQMHTKVNDALSVPKVQKVNDVLSVRQLTMRCRPAATQVSTYVEQLIREINEMPEEYLPILLEIVRLFRESITLKPAEASFRQGWKEALAGEMMPVSELWEGIA